MNRHLALLLILVLCLPGSLLWADHHDPNEPVDPNAPVAHLMFEGDVNDVYGNVVDGALIGEEDPNDPNVILVPTFADGVDGLGIVFDGTNYADLGGTFGDAVIAPLTSFTASVWVNSIDTGDWSRIFEVGADNDNRVALLAYSGGTPEEPSWTGMGGPRLEVKINGEQHNQNSPIDAIADGEWNHLAMTLDADANEAQVYSNGVLTDSKMGIGQDFQEPNAFTNDPSMIADPFTYAFVGNSWDGNPPITGTIDDLRLYNRVLTGDEIGALYLGLVPVLTVETMDSLVATDSDGDLITLDGIDVNDLVLATVVADYEKFPDHPAADAESFFLGTYASLDDANEIIIIFPEAVEVINIVERGANDLGFFQALDADGVPFGGLCPFAKSDWLKTEYNINNQTCGAIRIIANRPIYGVRVTPDGAMGLDPASVSGIVVIAEPVEE